MTAFLKVFDILPGWVYAAIIAGLLALSSVALVVERGKLLVEKTAHETTKTQLADYKTAAANRENLRTQQAMADQETKRELERNRHKAAQEATNELLDDTVRTATATAVAAERGRVRDDLIDAAARSTAGGQGGGDSVAVRRAEEAAPTLGRLLKACRAEGRSDGAELEGLASQLRSVIAQYESLTAKPKEHLP